MEVWNKLKEPLGIETTPIYTSFPPTWEAQARRCVHGAPVEIMGKVPPWRLSGLGKTEGEAVADLLGQMLLDAARDPEFQKKLFELLRDGKEKAS